jgi:anti-anti-sigma factor
MFTVEVDRSEDVIVLQCRGRVVRGDASYQLRDAVTSQRNARIIVLDLSDVRLIDGGGLGMLVFLHRWTCDNGIQLKLVNPSHLVREMLERTKLTAIFDVSTVDEALMILRSPEYYHRECAIAS